VEFAIKDVMIDEEARDEMFNLGVRSAPALFVDGKVVMGWHVSMRCWTFDRGRTEAL
jgi:glutaredoxin